MFSIQSIKGHLIKFLGGYTQEEHLLKLNEVLHPSPFDCKQYDIITLDATTMFETDSLPDRSYQIPIDVLKDHIVSDLAKQLSPYIKYRYPEPGEDVFYHVYRLTGTIDIVDKH